MTAQAPSLSVLDLVPVRTDQTSADAVAAARRLAQVADDRGFTRYWVAEHHAMPSVASTSPPVMVAVLAAATHRIRVGSGGVMLPNHAPLAVAEQFALLEAAFPGRIDLGIGRAPGTDPVTRYVLRGGAPEPAGTDPVSRFPEHVDDVVALLSPQGVGVELGERVHHLRATPRATAAPPVWLLGSSDFSARLAGERGLPYVFAHHFSGRGTAEALALYRSSFRPSAHLDAPRALVTVNVAVADDAAEARRLALPQVHAMVALRTGAPLQPQALVEDAEASPLPAAHEPLVEAMLSRWVVDGPEGAAGAVAALAEQHGVDEVVVHPVAGALRGTPADRAPARERTLELLAAAFT